MKKNELLQLSQMLARVGNMMARPGSQMDANTQALIQSAQAGIQQEALKKAEKQQEKKRKGGLFGQVGGTLAGLAMAPLTGGMSLPMAMAAMGGGTALGNVTGQALSTGKVDPGDALLSGGLSAFGTGASRLIGNMVQSRMGAVPQEEGPMPAFRRSGGAAIVAPTMTAPTEVPPGMMANLPVEPPMTPEQQQRIMAPIPPQGYWGRMGQHLLDTNLEPISGITDAMAQYYAGKSTMPRLGASDVMGLTPEQAMNVTQTAQKSALTMKEDMQREKDRAMQIKVKRQKLQNERDMLELEDQYAEMAERRKQAGKLEELETKHGYDVALAEQQAELESRKPIRVGASLLKPTGEELYREPEKGYTLRPDDVRFDASGQVVARNPRPVAAGGGAGSGTGQWYTSPDGRSMMNRKTGEIQPVPEEYWPEQKETGSKSQTPKTMTVKLPDGTSAEGVEDPGMLNGVGGIRFFGGTYNNPNLPSIYTFWSGLPEEVRKHPERSHALLQNAINTGAVDPVGAEDFMFVVFNKTHKEEGLFGKTYKVRPLTSTTAPRAGLPEINGIPVAGIMHDGNLIIVEDGVEKEMRLR